MCDAVFMIAEPLETSTAVTSFHFSFANLFLLQQCSQDHWGAPLLTPGFEAPKVSIFRPCFFFALLHSAFYFFHIFHNSNSKFSSLTSLSILFSQLMQMTVEVLALGLNFTYFRVIDVHLSLSCF